MNAQVQTMLIDFGSSSTKTSSPDINGNVWNDVTLHLDSNYPLNSKALVSKTNVATGFNLDVTTSFTGPGSNGALVNPSNALLGDFAISSATGDYFFLSGVSGQLKISNLTIGHTYKFKMFGSRNTTSSRITNYTFTGGNVVTDDLQTSGENIGNDGIYDGNDDEIYTSGFVAPNGSGDILIDVSIVSGGFGYLGVMEIEDYDGVISVAETDRVKSQFTLFPNPVENVLHISALKDVTIESAIIYSISGAKAKELEDFVNPNISDLSSGIYLLKIVSTNKVVSMFKIVKK
tara:strand:+ start:2073 stop:2942 length:870 start_codon:yes stop_codon:yes gene_type:complete